MAVQGGSVEQILQFALRPRKGGRHILLGATADGLLGATAAKASIVQPPAHSARKTWTVSESDMVTEMSPLKDLDEQQHMNVYKQDAARCCRVQQNDSSESVPNGMSAEIVFG